jgi:hypothetical protein
MSFPILLGCSLELFLLLGAALAASSLSGPTADRLLLGRELPLSLGGLLLAYLQAP